jgi:hypothetical protein
MWACSDEKANVCETCTGVIPRLVFQSFQRAELAFRHPLGRETISLTGKRCFEDFIRPWLFFVPRVDSVGRKGG